MKTILAGALLSAVLLVPAAQVEAAPACHGEPATLVGTPGSTISGTIGVDVVVTNGASRVETGQGNDLVCVTGATKDGKRMTMDTGPGNDRVRVTGRNAVKVFLGDGDDRFVGGRENDVVFAGYPDSYDYSPIDTGTDTIRTGAGDDLVRSNGAADSLSLGKGDDFLIWTGGGGAVDGGHGQNTMFVEPGLFVDGGTASWKLDNVRERLSRNGVVRFTWTDFSGFVLPYLAWTGEPLVVRGSDADETFDLARRGPSEGDLTIRAGGGDDLMLGSQGDDTLLGGSGRDVARGQDGHDRCVAEVREKCER